MILMHCNGSKAAGMMMDRFNEGLMPDQVGLVTLVYPVSLVYGRVQCRTDCNGLPGG